MRKLSRREFIGAAAGLGAALVTGCSKNEAGALESVKPHTSRLDVKNLAVASGKDPAKNTRAAVDALGGMKKLVREGDVVVIKPNIAWNRPPDAAATTNPHVVSELVKMCKEAGASKVMVLEHVIDKPAEALLSFTGIGPAAEAAGAEVRAAQNESDYRTISIPKGKLIKNDTCIKDILKADVFINVPIAKSHSSTKLTLGMKNLMGCIWDRQAWHQSESLDQCIVDYITAIRPDLTVLDANKILLTNGPKGPGNTKNVNQVIAGADPVAVDAYGATLFGLKPGDVGFIKLASELGVGEMDLSKISIKRVG
ncbi:MAG: DUF362 domain-containing protein [Armatimonadota bacterium]|nr:DUF362 domain-containing protein [bacterium]